MVGERETDFQDRRVLGTSFLCREGNSFIGRRNITINPLGRSVLCRPMSMVELESSENREDYLRSSEGEVDEDDLKKSAEDPPRHGEREHVKCDKANRLISYRHVFFAPPYGL